MLDGWLDTFQASDRSVRVVMEFFGAGGWIPTLSPPASRERILVASTRANRDVIWGANGLISFSQFFLSFMFQGESIGGAFNEAKSAIRRASGCLRQRPEIDDDGDGRANEKNIDGVVARNRYLGPAFLTGDDIPFIGRVNPTTLLISTNTLLLWAADVLDVDGISNVWCQVTEPHFDGVTPMPIVPLTYNGANDRYEAVYSGFNTRGVYTLSFFATDTLGQQSAAVQTDITVSDPFNQPDEFEVDEYWAGTDPTNRSSVLSFEPVEVPGSDPVMVC